VQPEDRDFADIPDPASFGDAPLPPIAPRLPSPTRREVTRRRVLGIASAVLWPMVILVAWGLRPRGSVDTGSMGLQSALWSAAIVVAAFAAFSGGKRGLGQDVRRSEILVFGGLLAFALIALFWIPARADTAFGAVGPASLLAPCMTLGLFVALPMLLAAGWSLRHAFVRAAGWRGATLGAAAGFGGVFVLTLHCGSPFGGHVLIAHGLPLVVATLAGALAGHRFARA
jgi:hypothetical protein